MTASIPLRLSALNFFFIRIQICSRCYQISELFQPFKVTSMSLYCYFIPHSDLETWPRTWHYFHCLGPTKGSVQVRGLFEWFVAWYVCALLIFVFLTSVHHDPSHLYNSTKKCLHFSHLTLSHHISCIYKWLIWFKSLMMDPHGPKRVIIFNVCCNTNI